MMRDRFSEDPIQIGDCRVTWDFDDYIEERWIFCFSLARCLEPEEIMSPPTLPEEFSDWTLWAVEPGDEHTTVLEYKAPASVSKADVTALLRYLILYFGV